MVAKAIPAHVKTDRGGLVISGGRSAMKAIGILSDTRRAGVCRSCGAAIEWARVASSNRNMPFDPPIVLVAALDLPGNVVRVDMARTNSHFATCPDAAEWRKRSK